MSTVIEGTFVADLVMASSAQIQQLEHLLDTNPGFRREAGMDFMAAVDKVEELFSADPEAHLVAA